jgi:AcrR family transcriptional regulator
MSFGRETLPGLSAPKGTRPRVNVAERRISYIRIASRVFLERGVGQATMEDVARAAGVPKVLIYRIFPSKKALLDAIFETVTATIHESYRTPCFVYGGRVRDIVERARRCPEPFILVFRYSQVGIDPGGWSETITDLFSGYTRERWFRPGPEADKGAEERAEFASRLNVPPLLDTMVRWLENRDGLDDLTRFKWWARISRDYHMASREAYRLGTANEDYSMPE